MDFTIIIPYYNGQDTIGRLLETIPGGIPVLVVDDHSDIVFNRKHLTNNAKLLKASEKGYFTGAVNYGIENCHNDVLILNQDTYFNNESWLNLLKEKYNEYDLIGEGISGGHPAWPNGYIHGTFMFIKRKVIKQVGLMNQKLYPLWGSTCEYQLRACRQGFRALPLGDIPGFVHLRQGNFGSSIKSLLKRTRDRRRFIKTPPEVSVVTTNYNYGKYLIDLVNSLIGGETSLGHFEPQTFQSFELIIVDDCSTDNSRTIIGNLCDDYKGIKSLFLNQNVGSAAALNRGIEQAKGKYISVIDADDMMDTHRLKSLYEIQIQNPHSFIFDECTLFGNGKIGIEVDGKIKTTFRTHEYDFEEVLKKNGVHKGIMFPKQAWLETGGYPEQFKHGREDWAFNVALGIAGYCGVKVDRQYYLYRREGQNRTLQNTNPKSRRVFQQQMLEQYADIYAGARPMGCCGQKNMRRARAVTPAPNAAVANSRALPGKNGFAILEYVGSNAGDNSWWGPETGTEYIFGGIRKIGYVDKTDAPKMLKLRERDKPIFRPVKQKKVLPIRKTEVKEKTIEDAVIAQLDKEIKQEEKEQAKKEKEQVQPLSNPANMTVKAITDIVPGMGTDELRKVLKMEKEGKARKSAIKAIEEALDV